MLNLDVNIGMFVPDDIFNLSEDIVNSQNLVLDCACHAISDINRQVFDVIVSVISYETCVVYGLQLIR